MPPVNFEPENVTWDGQITDLRAVGTNDNRTAGTVVFRQENGQVSPASCTSEQSAMAIGVCVGSAQSDQFVAIAANGVLNLQAIALQEGGIYCAGPGGSIMRYEDLGSGDYVTIVGVAVSESQLKLNIWPTGTQKA